jgi:hypothetical protein
MRQCENSQRIAVDPVYQTKRKSLQRESPTKSVEEFSDIGEFTNDRGYSANFTQQFQPKTGTAFFLNVHRGC